MSYPLLWPLYCNAARRVKCVTPARANINKQTNSLPNLKPEEPFDLIFLDAQKSGYPTYLKTILEQSKPGSANRILRPGGLIVADNVLRRAIVADESDDNPHAVKAKAGLASKSEYETDNDIVHLRKYNDDVAESDRLESWLLPLFDGINLARLLD